MANSKVTVAVIQLWSEPFELDKNFAKAEARIRTAAAHGAALAVLPEYYLTGWEPNDERFTQVAARYDEFLAKYCALALELQICIVPGTIIQKNTDGDLVNIASFIDHNGKVLHSYTKKNLWHPERDHLTPGITDRHVAFDTPIGKVGMLICWDLAFNEAFRELIVQGAQIIVVPAFWLGTDGESSNSVVWNQRSEQVLLDSMLVSRAFENTCAVVFCNTGGCAQDYLGLSQVTIPLVGTLARLPNQKEATLLTDINFKILEAAEETYKIRSDLAKTNWHYN